MNPFSSGTRLRDMIRSIRACKTAAEERAVVRKECAAIRASIHENDQDYRHRNLAKLMFIHMLGYPTHFGQMECLKLIASAGFPEKRIGYLGLMLLLDERQEVLMLVTNSLKQDLNHTNQYIVGLALCALGNICSAEMARDLSPEVERLLQFRDPNVRKKAALCSIRIIKKVPDLAENFIDASAALLKEKHHGVLITGVQLCTDLCKNSSEALEHFKKKCLDAVVKTLKDVVNSSYSPEYDISGIMDPFLHIRLLKLLRVLGQGDADASDSMNDILAQVATKADTNRNAGNAILYECVETIMSIEDNGGLRVLAINILGKFLSNRDNNIRYVALNMLMKAMSVDTQAVQRHRSTILECVKDSDASIRKRALELIYLLINESNVKPLTKELIDYLVISDQEFKGDLTAKICSIVEKFSPEKIWYIDQLLKVLSEAGNFVKVEVYHALIVVITNATDLHGYAVRALYKAFQASAEQESLTRVAVWCVGEYGDMLVNNAGMLDVEDPVSVTESDAIDLVEAAIKRHTSDPTTKAMALVALLKLSSRFPSCSERIKEIVVQHKGSFLLELQQRSIEFSSIIGKHTDIKSALVERMPVLDEATFRGRNVSVPTAVLTSNGPSNGDSLKVPNGVAKLTAAPLVDLLDLSSYDVPMPSSSGGDFLQDLLGVDLSPVATQSDGKFSVETSSTICDFDVQLEVLSAVLCHNQPAVTAESLDDFTEGLHLFLRAGKIGKLLPGILFSHVLESIDLVTGLDSSLPASASLKGRSKDCENLRCTKPTKSGTDVLLDLLSIGSSPVQQSSSPMADIFSPNQATKAPTSPLYGLTSPASQSIPAASPPVASPMIDLLDGLALTPSTPEKDGQTYPSIVAFESSSLRITFDFSKSPGNSQSTMIQATFTNLSSRNYSDFVFQAAVPKFLQLHLDPASGNTLIAGGNSTVTQTVRVTNSQHGKKSLVMRIRISYKTNGKDILEEGQISHFPRDL